jgi:hypothetical protein
VDPVPDPLLLRKSGSAGNRTQDLWVSSQELKIVELNRKCGFLYASQHYGSQYSLLERVYLLHIPVGEREF